MNECEHHWHINWFDKFQEVIQCCHCGETREESDYKGRSVDETCGTKVRSRVSFTPPIHDYVTLLLRCKECDGEGSIETPEGEYEPCAACEGEGYLTPE